MRVGVIGAGGVRGILRRRVRRSAATPTTHALGDALLERDISAAIEAPGVIKHNGALARIVFGEVGGQRTTRATASSTFYWIRVPTQLSTSVEELLLKEFAFLVGLSSVRSTTRQPVGVIRAKPRTRKLLQEVLAEVVRVGRALGIEIPEDLATQQMAFIDTLPHAMTSMLNGLEERPSSRNCLAQRQRGRDWVVEQEFRRHTTKSWGRSALPTCTAKDDSPPPRRGMTAPEFQAITNRAGSKHTSCWRHEPAIGPEPDSAGAGGHR